jgi:hypothetical protein
MLTSEKRCGQVLWRQGILWGFFLDNRCGRCYQHIIDEKAVVIQRAPGIRAAEKRAARSPLEGRRAASVSQDLEQEIDVVVEFGERLPQFGDLPARMEDGRVVAPAKIAANLG